MVWYGIQDCGYFSSRNSVSFRFHLSTYTFDEDTSNLKAEGAPADVDNLIVIR
jgi:hypothetical protein